MVRGGNNRSGSARNSAADAATLLSGGDTAKTTDGADSVEAQTTPLQALPLETPTKTQQNQQICSPSAGVYGVFPPPLLSVPSPARARDMQCSGETGSVMATSPSTLGAATDSWPLPKCEARIIPVTPQSSMQHHPGGGYREHLRAIGTQAMQQTERWQLFSTVPPSTGATNVVASPTHYGPCPDANLAELILPASVSSPCSMMELPCIQPPFPPAMPPATRPTPSSRPLTSTHLPVQDHHSFQNHLLDQGTAQMANSVAPVAPRPPPSQPQRFDGWPMDLQSRSPLEVAQQPLQGIVLHLHTDCVQTPSDFIACASMGGFANVPATEHIQVVGKSPEKLMMNSIGEINGLSADQLAAKLSAAAQCLYDD